MRQTVFIALLRTLTVLPGFWPSRVARPRQYWLFQGHRIWFACGPISAIQAANQPQPRASI